jgi:hypothetical protein
VGMPGPQKLHHSLRLAVPRSTAPACRRRSTTPASRAGRDPSMASDPAVALSAPAVAMLSLSSTGMPCSGGNTPDPASRSAAARAPSGSSSMTAWTAGSTDGMRRRHRSTRSRGVSSPAAKARWPRRGRMLRPRPRQGAATGGGMGGLPLLACVWRFEWS